MYTFGVDLGGTSTKLALVSSDGRILQDRRLRTVANQPPMDAIAEFRPVVEEMITSAGYRYPPPAGIGIGIPGVVDYRSGWLTLSGPLGWKDVAVGELGRTVFECDVVVDTDVNAGALADLHLGNAREASEMLYISWGTGIGAGLVVSRKLYHTRGGAMCNLGHIVADPLSKMRCYCGCTGCLEVEAGGKSMVIQANDALDQGESSMLSDLGEVTPEQISKAASLGDPLAQRILHRSAVLMARVLGGVLALLNPDTVIFGGGVSSCLPVIRSVFDDELRLRTPSFSIGLTTLSQSIFGESAGVVGASLLPLASSEQ
jgi:glucokinase